MSDNGHKFPLRPLDIQGAVDLDQIPCYGCRHLAGKECRRYPMIWINSQPVPDDSGAQVGWSQPGWSFPPASRKCGEYSQR